MPITVPSEVTAAVSGPAFKFCRLYQIPGTTPAVNYLTDHWKNITFNGNGYVSSSSVSVMNVDPAKRELDVSADSLQIEMDNTDKTIYEQYASNNQVGKIARIFIAFLDDSGDLLTTSSAVEMYTGIVDSWSQTDSTNESKFVLRLAGYWATFNVVKGRYTNQASQSEFYTGDTIFEFSHQDDLPVKWGT